MSLVGLPATGRPRWQPRSAVAYAAGEVTAPDKNYDHLCDHFCAWSYGFEGSGYYSARVHFNSIPSKYRHKVTDPRRVPRGALVFWPNLGSYGHITISAGGGRVYSNDILRKGRIDKVRLDTITDRWNAGQAYWTEPYFAASFGVNPHKEPVVAVKPKPVAKPVSKPVIATAPNQPITLGPLRRRKLRKHGWHVVNTARIRRWQRNHGQPETGRLTRAQFKQIVG